jgi:serine phosphatase RsbU (regulator of sigma subunit)
VTVSVGDNGTGIRIEVEDASNRGPLRAAPSTTNMTGRGLALVEALADRWGVVPNPDGGKLVWSELGVEPAPGRVAAIHRALPSTLDLDLAHRGPNPAEPMYTVELGDVPTSLLLEAKAHIDNLAREFSLAAASGERGESVIPEHLATLIETVMNGFADARVAIKRQAIAASARGETRTRLTLQLPVSAAEAGAAYLAALDDADEYAQAARLLTLAAPADHRLFRRWYVESLIDQLSSLAVGIDPPPVVPFENVLFAEVRRLSAAQRIGERAERLQRVTAALARARTPEDVAEVVVSEGVSALGASGGGLLVLGEDGEHLAVPGVVGYNDELVGLLRDERIGERLPAATALRTGTPVWLESQHERDQHFPLLKGLEAATIAICAVPLIIGDESRGALRFSFTTPKLFDADERSFVLALAAQTAQTLERTERYESERRAALQLQRALLPDRLSEIPGWERIAYYSPAGDNEAGGDFYDVIALADGRFVVVVGDVMGRGIEAAAAMGQVRSTIRAYAMDDADPTRVFHRVSAYFAALEMDQLVTVLYLLIDRETGVIEIGNAGHLPPIVLGNGRAKVAEIEVGLPFGVDQADCGLSTVTLPRGGALIAYTDGLVERHSEDIDVGIARALCAASAAPSEATAEGLVKAMVDLADEEELADDDITVVAVRRL